ncbi:MAG: hypothetical protein RJQ14_00505, partial [Marinoscillum sp.]
SRFDAMDKCCDEIKKAVRSTFEGHPHDAYQHFKKTMTSIRKELNKLTINKLGDSDLRNLYRVRHTSSPSLSKEELFHIPFEDRHKVATQRYSIPGLPCLYLSGSLYTCWEEMGRPPFHELQISGFWLKDATTLKVLNFGNRPKRLNKYLSPDGSISNTYKNDETQLINTLINSIVIWPLMAACSIIVKNRNAPYKPEYVIPQMVLQWITKNEKFDGLCYFSTHVSAVTNIQLPTSNFVFPAQNVVSSGRCSKLCKSFKMTDPISWQVLSAVNAGEGVRGGDLPMYNYEIIDGIEEPYWETGFGEVELKINKMISSIAQKNLNGEPALGDICES